MLQSFETTADPSQGPGRLARLRAAMADEGLDGFFVPRADAHQGEYVADCDARLAWLTGFTGSAGFCLALKDAAGVFIDGRYRTQVKEQVDQDAFTPVPWPETAPADWLREHLTGVAVIGFDPWLHTRGAIEEIETALKGSRIALVPAPNLIDRIWQDRPPAPQGEIRPHPQALAGQSHAEKRAALAAELREAGETAAVLTSSDSIAWLLNIRGTDIPRIPVVQGFAILHEDARVSFFTHPARPAGIGDHLGPEVWLYPAAAFEGALRELKGPVRVDKARAPDAVVRCLEDAGVAVSWGDDPCVLPKARKTEAEIAGARAAHLRDAAAMVEFLTWFDATAHRGGLTEIDLVVELEAQRRATGKLRDISFETISGAGPHGAVIHYRVTHETNRTLKSGDLVVLDSGGQYDDGTTDITRTLPVVRVGSAERAAFTRVLQGMIAISRVRFPKGVTGRDLDALARYPLWLAHLDYDHGTGHGVGSYLSVHEGPQGLSRRSKAVLEPGMILSNEPGYYREGAFGIRIENLIVVKEAERPENGDDREMLEFETLTLVPIDRRLIEARMLTPGERDWLNAYHAEVLQNVKPLVSEAAREWLVAACAPV